MNLSEECLTILQNKLPWKSKDLGSFTIPNLIGNIMDQYTLTNLYPGIIVMPYKVFRKIGIGESPPSMMIIQLAN